MCEVCAAFGRGRHWTDRAGLLSSRPESVDIRSYRAERKRVLQLVNALVEPTGLHARDWDGEAFVLDSPSGASHRAANLSELWQVVQRLAGAPVDPLALPLPIGRAA
jgi:hypothetical protein